MRSSSRNRNGIFDTCKRFCVVVVGVIVVVFVMFVVGVVLDALVELFPLIVDVPFERIVHVDCGEMDVEEF